MNNARTILLSVLDIIGYSEDKEKFATEFLQNVSLQALLDLFNTLPQDKKDHIQQKINNASSNPPAIQETLKMYFTDLQLQEAIENAAKNAATEYMKAIDSTLSDTQRENLMNLFRELNQNNLPNKKDS